MPDLDAPARARRGVPEPGRGSGAGSATRPVRRISRASRARLTGCPDPGCSSLAQVLLLGEQSQQDLAATSSRSRISRDADRVHHRGPVPTLADQTGAAQHRQLLGQVARLDLDLRKQLVHGVVALAEQLQHPDPARDGRACGRTPPSPGTAAHRPSAATPSRHSAIFAHEDVVNRSSPDSPARTSRMRHRRSPVLVSERCRSLARRGKERTWPRSRRTSGRFPAWRPWSTRPGRTRHRTPRVLWILHSRRLPITTARTFPSISLPCRPVLCSHWAKADETAEESGAVADGPLRVSGSR